ncbi:hypothetical protein ERO13_D11G190940v2 [Gossypium hirsutum]|uniref:Uncharacterized protein n=3 Tax=Gossypium TaxID=3633 RepID=A0A5J5PDJ8_GOSBA|nr:hypothetical protein ES319_D11G201500v1 [Gossypium barbadense]KAG4121190.1 hypothetical protein ERO13_D11G190940v2 [Gossypium hirsutum]TYH44664.1 hypothetical protein ES332_D11G210800v1 [Gossypium tomentosum]TYI56394.1 hypothetical protein E1A91_D11G206900v1 [Gossypium mustelinum]
MLLIGTSTITLKYVLGQILYAYSRYEKKIPFSFPLNCAIFAELLLYLVFPLPLSLQ